MNWLLLHLVCHSFICGSTYVFAQDNATSAEESPPGRSMTMNPPMESTDFPSVTTISPTAAHSDELTGSLLDPSEYFDFSNSEDPLNDLASSAVLSVSPPVQITSPASTSNATMESANSSFSLNTTESNDISNNNTVTNSTSLSFFQFTPSSDSSTITSTTSDLSTPIISSTSATPALSTSVTSSTSVIQTLSTIESSQSSSTLHYDTSTSSIKSDMSTSSLLPTPTATQSHHTPSSIPSTAPPTTQPRKLSVWISETNILLVKDPGSLFIELAGAKKQNLDGIFLVIRNAGEKNAVLQSVKLSGSVLNDQGLLVVDKLNLANVDFSSVVIALYSNESRALDVTNQSLLDSLLYSVDPGSVDSEVVEVYQPGRGNDVYVNSSVLGISSGMSMSLCKGNQMHPRFVLTKVSKNQKNQCEWKTFGRFHLKLTMQVGKKMCPAWHLPNQFQTSLSKEIVTRVNGHRPCGLTDSNIGDLIHRSRCIDEYTVISVTFIVDTCFIKQFECIRIGYESFIAEKSSIPLDGRLYVVSNCSLQCVPDVLPAASQGDDNNIKVTVAVVVSCIGIFLVILMAVIIYMKRKRRGLLQFRMTRLDEDDDDLVGDMDDFVGNQGATFSNFR